MSDRQAISDMAALAQLRTVLTQRAADEAKLAADRAEGCRDAHAKAEELSLASIAAWSAHLADTRFDPAIGLLLAANAVARDQEAAHHRTERDRSVSEAARHQTRFERAMAEEKVGKALLIDLRRRAEREREEQRLAEVGDLVTCKWIQR